MWSLKLPPFSRWRIMKRCRLSDRHGQPHSHCTNIDGQQERERERKSLKEGEARPQVMDTVGPSHFVRSQQIRVLHSINGTQIMHSLDTPTALNGDSKEHCDFAVAVGTNLQGLEQETKRSILLIIAEIDGTVVGHVQS